MRLQPLVAIVSMAAVSFGIASGAGAAEEAPAQTVNERHEVELAEVKAALEAALAENAGLRSSRDAAEESIAALQQNLAVAQSEGEVFRRRAGEMKLRLEALGIDGAAGNSSKLEQRLLKAVSDLKLTEDERKKLQDALIEFSEAVLRYQKSAVSTDAEARVGLEAASRAAARALGVAPPELAEGAAVPSTLTDGMVISVKDELALVVANVGARNGVKVGMPFQVLRGDQLIGTVRVVDVREKIAGAVVQNLHSDKERIKFGDRLKIDAHP
jgi:hypothetical protein